MFAFISFCMVLLRGQHTAAQKTNMNIHKTQVNSLTEHAQKITYEAHSHFKYKEHRP